MEKIYAYENYRVFLSQAVERRGRGKRGELQRLAAAASIHTSTLSLIMKGTRDLTEEQAVRTGKYFGLSSDELRYFLLLVLIERAGSELLRDLYRNDLEKLKTNATQLATRLPVERVLEDEEKSLFYSSWHFSAVRVLSSIPKLQTVPAIAARLQVPTRFVEGIATFLERHALCVKKNGLLKPGPQSTHLGADSPHITRHHANWRIRAMQSHPTLNADRELAYSGALSLSKDDAVKIRSILVEAIARVCEESDASPAETGYCLNVDWFEF